MPSSKLRVGISNGHYVIVEADFDEFVTQTMRRTENLILEKADGEVAWVLTRDIVLVESLAPLLSPKKPVIRPGQWDKGLSANEIRRREGLQ